MQYVIYFHPTRRVYRFTLRLFTTLFFFLNLFTGNTQICPPNIDFEKGNFDGWTCYTGNVSAVGAQNQISLYASGPVAGHHTMNSLNDGGADPYGGFPVNCPNGSGHSVRLGNDLGGGQAEGMSYEFTIPANQNVYSLIYHYAVVFQDPNHLEYQQPRLEIEITDVSDNTIIYCSSFTFIPYGNILPGFFISPNPVDTTPVWCKDWSAVSINLDNHAGKTIRLFFKTGDCTFKRHFGYAYIDVNSECSSEFVGATYCPDDSAVNVTAPFGYQNYTWWNTSFSQVLGTSQQITFQPLPVAGTTIAVEVVPYNGYGCLDTLYAHLIDTLTVVSNAGRDTLSCNRTPVPIGGNPKPGLVYSWSPPTGLNNAEIANPLANPSTTTTYVLTTNHDGGGCVSRDTVIVRSSIIDNSLELLGKSSYCLGNGDSSILRVQPTDHIQWYKDDYAITGAIHPSYRVNQSGLYYAVLRNNIGCSISTRKQLITIDVPKPGIRYPVQYALIDVPVTLKARDFGTSILWTPAVYLNNDSIATPVFTSNEDQTYTIDIKTASGCRTVDTLTVKAINSVKVFVPTAFTPNSDGRNDFLHPVMMGIKDFRFFRVYNRWGKLLFETKTELPGWDGKLNGVPQSSQVVVWVVEGIGLDGKKYQQKGTTVLVR